VIGHPPLVALYDANVLYPAPIRDLLIRLARAGVVSARWSYRASEARGNRSLSADPSVFIFPGK